MSTEPEPNCPSCEKGHISIVKGRFELKATVMQGGPNKGKVNFSVYPEGLPVEQCDEDICQESFIDGESGRLIDEATAKAREKFGYILTAMLETIRVDTAINEGEKEKEEKVIKTEPAHKDVRSEVFKEIAARFRATRLDEDGFSFSHIAADVVDSWAAEKVVDTGTGPYVAQIGVEPMPKPEVAKLGGWPSYIALEEKLAEAQKALAECFKIHSPDSTPCHHEQAGGAQCVNAAHYRPVTYDDWMVPQRALIESQAREQALRAVLTTVRTYSQDARKYVGPSVFHDALAAVVKHADAALAAPTDDTALREFGLRVGHRVANRPDLRDSRDAVEAAVDAVLRGE